MDCNRDEASRAKEIAERKFQAKDIKGAMKFAKKAQKLFPELDGISQMVMTFNVYISAEEEKILGDSNWYGVLGVTPLADDDTIRKQYRKLALQLHPDKNRSIGAEGAFQLVSQAWSVLSDKSKRKAYEQRRGAMYKNRNPSTKVGPTPPPPTQNGFHNVAKTAPSQTKVPKGSNSKRDSEKGHHQPAKKEGTTFWTVCHQCKMQYEYLRRYLNHHLLCPNCHEAYFAVEIDPPSTRKRKHTSQQGFNQNNESNNNNAFQWVPFSESNATASAVKAASMVQQAYEKVKRERQKAQAATRKEKNLASKRTMGAEASRHSNSAKRRKVTEECGMNKEGIKCGSNPTMSFSGNKHDNFHSDIRQLLMEKAREEVRDKLKEPISAAMAMNATGEEIIGITKENGSICTQNVIYEQMSVNVPDSDFYDFDKDRTEKCFEENQVWALYDDDDGMPRNYAMIHEVISLNPIKVRMSWLRPVSSFFVSGFSKTCGEFRIGRHEIFNSLESFSHKIRYVKSTSKTIQVFPRKGDVWALYRNWSSEWNELTEDEVVHKYDMVEVLEDYDEEFGVIVIPLIKVAGFKSIFHQHFNPNEIKRIPKEEMSKFSHLVPSHLHSGQEKVKSIKGCREVDPAATPSEFLQTISKFEEIQLMESDNDNIEFLKVNDCDGSEKYLKGCSKLDLKAIPEILQTISKTDEIEFMKIDNEIEFVKAVDYDGNTNTNVGEIKTECPLAI